MIPCQSKCAGVLLDGVVTVVDAKHIERQLQRNAATASTPALDSSSRDNAAADSAQHAARSADASASADHAGDAAAKPAVNEAQQQVAYADVVLLNKCDLVTEDELSRIEAALRRHNALAKVRSKHVGLCCPCSVLAGHHCWHVAIDLQPLLTDGSACSSSNVLTSAVTSLRIKHSGRHNIQAPGLYNTKYHTIWSAYCFAGDPL